MTKQVAFKVLSEFWCWYQVNLVLTSFLSMTLRQNKDNNNCRNFMMPKCLNLNDFCISSRNDSRNAVAKNLLTALFSTVRRFALLVSPGFEPRQRESKSLVLPLHHETTQCAQPAWAAGNLLPQRCRCGKHKLCITAPHVSPKIL